MNEPTLDFDFITALLDYGLIGLGILLAILMYSLLRQAQKKDEINPKLYRLVKLYFIFSFSFFVLSIGLEVFEYNLEKVVSIEVDAKDPNLWKGLPDEYDWFNAQYSIAGTDKFIKSNSEKINKGVKYKLLLFHGISQKEIRDSKERFERMRTFLRGLSENAQLSSENMHVKLVFEKRLPMMSFFNTVKSNKPVVIYYLDELMQRNGEPTFTCQVEHSFVVKAFNTRFEDIWASGHHLKLEMLLDSNVPTDFFYEFGNL